jgi:glycosyltransferase involved in cell wall biosynthesis
MFSRRVTEAAACGAAIISGPALGMNRYLEAAGHVVRLESEAAQALENLMHHDAYRWRVALKGARAVMRAHTTQTRLTQMLRTAGIRVLAPELPEISLFSETITQVAAQSILNQTVLPAKVAAATWSEEAKAQLQAVGVECIDAHQVEIKANEYWLCTHVDALENAEPEDIEDLAWTTVYSPYARSVLDRADALAQGEWAGVAFVSDTVESDFQLIRANESQSIEQLIASSRQKETLALRKPPKQFAQAPNVAPTKTIVIAGHDLKFIKPFYPYFTKSGMRLLLDFWNGHNQHNETASKRLVRQADTVFCEWMMGNAIWYGKHKREGQKLVGRLHAQELRSPLFDKVPFDMFDTVIFVGPHMLRQAINRNPVLEKNGVVIYNGVDVEALQAVPRKPTNGKVLGIVGIVPQSKRFDRALDILKELRNEDKGYTLRVKGKRPEDYPWMKNRPEEMAWYESQYQRLESDPDLKGAVFFDPQGNDMPEWYAGIDYVLSVSDHESFHLAVAEGVASGCKPIVFSWDGAKEIYKDIYISNDVSSAVSYLQCSHNKESVKMDIESFNMVNISILIMSAMGFGDI